MTQTTSGLILEFGPAPASYDEAGFDAVVVDKVGEVTSIGELGKVFANASYITYEGRQEVRKKTSFTLKDPTIEVVIDESNAGQVAIEAATSSDAEFTFKITRQNGDKIYWTGQVSSFTFNPANGEFEKSMIETLSQTEYQKFSA